MKNTIESAKDFLTKYRDERTHPVSVDYFAEMMVSYAASVQKEYQIDFGNHLRCKVIVGGNNISVYGAVNGWGDGIPPTDIIVKRLNPDMTFINNEK